ncbi:MAG TPA: hypothetical protein VKZ53_03275 [Candidatus Angelobacter sp.]|nr:hypothetical protein [Candidatus Angelobacter sp.]
MNCKQFQEVLPYIIETGGNPEEEEHLRSCQACSDLVNELQYIAEQAKLLLPMHDPHPRVWSNVEQSLQREGLIREGRTPRLGHLAVITEAAPRRAWTPLGLGMATAAVLALAMVLVNFPARQPGVLQGSKGVSAAVQQPATQFEGEDKALLGEISQHRPEVSSAYQDSLGQINSYIADAQKAVDADPADANAHALLMDAYDQKAMLYEMGTVRSLD